MSGEARPRYYLTRDALTRLYPMKAAAVTAARPMGQQRQFRVGQRVRRHSEWHDKFFPQDFARMSRTHSISGQATDISQNALERGRTVREFDTMFYLKLNVSRA